LLLAHRPSRAVGISRHAVAASERHDGCPILQRIVIHPHGDRVVKEQQTNAGKKETRQANQVLKKAVVDEQREEGGEGKETEARIAPRSHSPKKGNNK
jgi:hypothetical protein